VQPQAAPVHQRGHDSLTPLQSVEDGVDLFTGQDDRQSLGRFGADDVVQALEVLP
jgi:hypothetical protein